MQIYKKSSLKDTIQTYSNGISGYVSLNFRYLLFLIKALSNLASMALGLVMPGKTKSTSCPDVVRQYIKYRTFLWVYC